MMTAQRWHEYQNSYKKYGLDMKPTVKKLVKQTSKSVVTAKDKIRLVLLVMFTGALCISLIVATAYTAGVKYEINTMIKKNVELQGEIENLNVKIKQATNIKTIEIKAQQELGMVYPDLEQSVFLTPDDTQVGDFAMLLKEQAYN